MIMRGAVAAALGVFARFVDETCRPMWSEAKKLDESAVRRAALADAGFEAERFAALVEDAELEAPLRAKTERSVARGTFGSPTFFVGYEIYFGKGSAARYRGGDPGGALCRQRIRHPRDPRNFPPGPAVRGGGPDKRQTSDRTPAPGRGTEGRLGSAPPTTPSRNPHH
jgi:hypothetical protein